MGSMHILEFVGGILIVLCAIFITFGVVSMEGKSGQMNALSGGNDSSYLGKHKNNSDQARMVRLVKVLGFAFVLITLAVYVASAIIVK